MLNYNKMQFLSSDINETGQYIYKGLEIAFLGYSNSGKSSVINTLARRKKKLANVSRHPGSTQTVNFFQIVPGYNLVDLPGYGYSKMSKKLKEKIHKSIFKYLDIRDCLKGIVLIMDIRFPVRTLDKLVLKISVQKKLNTLVLLNKSDKYTNLEQKKQLSIVTNQIHTYSNKFEIKLFSSIKKNGIKMLQKILNCWYRK
ncbi:probable GTP-binding protein [Buchnera aphidicola (Nipponaphis monzeni)]|uniref:Probable GTP-binding protein EngB n=1 Tax=Buchnera aphidicola (Nipponaphis monzeni) TaxID=2495405 RepID=A0A455TAH8_9GAMM|nr:ribosome biogenesis GTP-binding protein YihA/YsxC [Buchnera aphidicola]BBI01329.1 probable GTP-binding protein [Buchnera aphidicola (Nipponaphis monzeni)]